MHVEVPTNQLLAAQIFILSFSPGQRLGNIWLLHQHSQNGQLEEDRERMMSKGYSEIVLHNIIFRKREKTMLFRVPW